MFMKVVVNFFGTLDGTSLTATYCVDLLHPISRDNTYNTTTYNTTGQVFGSSVNNASKISWLLYQYGGSATSLDAQSALQAAIWKTEYGTDFQVDGADNTKTGNSKTMIDTYKYFMSELGTHTYSVTNVLWISPDSNTLQHSTHYQGLVGLTGTGAKAAIPEAGSLALLLPAALPLVGMMLRRRR